MPSMDNGYQPPSSRRGFILLGFAIAAILLIAFIGLLFVSGGFMHGD